MMNAKKPRRSDHKPVLPLRAPVLPPLLELGKKHMSSNAKTDLLKQLRDLGFLPDDAKLQKYHIRAEKEALAATETPFGQLLRAHAFRLAGNKGNATFPVQNPLAMLHIALSKSPRFSKYVRDAVAVHGLPSYGNPWGLVLYFDEVTCGNPLAMGSKRKIQGVYWTVYELGPQALSDETAWFELACFQDEDVSKFDGKMSHVVEQTLRFFFDDDGHDLRTGLTFDLLQHGPFTLFMHLEILIADIKAHVEVVGSNGVNAMLPCLSCDHVVSYAAKRRPELAHNDDFVTLACLDPSKLGKRSSADIKALLQRLADSSAQVQAGTMTKEAFDEATTWNGYKHIPNNVILNERLNVDIVRALVYDWMHLMFQTGNWNREFWRVLKLCERAGIPSYYQCGEYLRTWMWPRAHAVRALWRNVFSVRRITTAATRKKLDISSARPARVCRFTRSSLSFSGRSPCPRRPHMATRTLRTRSIAT